MNKQTVDFLIRICFWFNAVYIPFVIIIPFFIIPFISYEDLMDFFDSRIYDVLYIITIIPILGLWISNLIFFYKKDRNSKAIIPLILFNFIYSPIYYYRVRLKRSRPLQNNIYRSNDEVSEIRFEDYESDEDFDNDVNSIKKGNGFLK